jgi:uncharacterized membrane protein YczE
MVPVTGREWPASEERESRVKNQESRPDSRLLSWLLAHPYADRVLPLPPLHDLWPRLARLLFGLTLFGLGLALMVIADLGLSPWDVLHQGISRQTGIPIGTVVIITGFAVLLLWIPLKERIGIGTIANAIVIGIVLDGALLVLPEALNNFILRWAALLVGVVIVAIGSGFYIGAGLGPGPRDGLMTGLARRGIPIAWARAGIEIAALVIGWLLGGTVGVGTLIFAFEMGPLVQFFLARLSIIPVAPRVSE